MPLSPAPRGSVGVGFGLTCAVAIRWDPEGRTAVSVDCPGLSRRVVEGDDTVAIVPAAVRYPLSGGRIAGAPALDEDVGGDLLVQRFRPYVERGSPAGFSLGAVHLTVADAGREFLAEVLDRVKGACRGAGLPVAIGCPPGAAMRYRDWLDGLGEELGTGPIQPVAEPVAAALGAGAILSAGQEFGLIDVGEYVAVGLYRQGAGGDCECLAAARADVAGSPHAWLCNEILAGNRLRETDFAAKGIRPQLLRECRTAIEALLAPESGPVEVTAHHADLELTVATTVDRDLLGQIVSKRELPTMVNRVVRNALARVWNRGVGAEAFEDVVVIGEWSRFPVVRETIARHFPRARIHDRFPISAIARGAAQLAAGDVRVATVGRDYALRWLGPDGKHHYEVVVPRGTPVPSPGPTRTMTLAAGQESQARLGLAIFELGEACEPDLGERVELAFGPDGRPTLRGVAARLEAKPAGFVNADKPIYLVADPPARKGEPCFELRFAVDDQRRLLLTSTDLRTGQTTRREQPIAELS